MPPSSRLWSSDGWPAALLPLAALLRLTLTFPDRMQSRFHVALRAGSVGRLRLEVEWVRAEGIGDDLAVAAETVLVLGAALNTHDPQTRDHSQRVPTLTEVLAAELHLPADGVDKLRWSALLHDCGKPAPAAATTVAPTPRVADLELCSDHARSARDAPKPPKATTEPDGKSSNNPNRTPTQPDWLDG